MEGTLQRHRFSSFRLRADLKQAPQSSALIVGLRLIPRSSPESSPIQSNTPPCKLAAIDIAQPQE